MKEGSKHDTTVGADSDPPHSYFTENFRFSRLFKFYF